MWRQAAGRWLPPLLWMGVIFYLSSQSSLPQVPNPALQQVLSYLAHATEHALLALLFIFLFTLLYAISDEFHQGLVPGRTASPANVGTDALGSLFVLLLKFAKGKSGESRELGNAPR